MKDRTATFFKHVFAAAGDSKDPSSQVGAVIVQDDTIISCGYNGFPRNVQDTEERLNDRPTKLAYTVHAEHNAILNCARRGFATLGARLYTTAYPCDKCMEAIIQAGIKKVIYHKKAQEAFYSRSTTTNWNDVHKDSIIMAQEAGIEIGAWEGEELGMTTLIGGKTILV